MAGIITRIQRFAGAMSHIYKRAQSLDIKNPTGWLKIFGDTTSAGVTVTKKESIGISAVYTSARIIGETIASLTFQVIRKDGDSREQVYNHIRYMGGNSPDPDRGMTAYDYWAAVGLHLTTWGNSYSIIKRNEYSAKVKGLTLTYPSDWLIKENADGSIIYQHQKMGVFTPDEILHFKINSWEGIVGLSPISVNRETFGLAIKQQRYAARILGEKPPGYLYTDTEVKDDTRKSIKDSWEDMTTGSEMGGTPVLTGGLKYQPIMLPPGDAQYVEGRNLTKEDIYSIFRIPPILTQNFDKTPYNTAEEQDLSLLKHTITPYLRNIEQEMELKLLPVSNRESKAPLQIRFNQDSLLRSDYKSRAEGARIYWNMGVMSANDIRKMENLNPIEGGDRYYVPLNMAPSDKIDEILIKEGGQEEARQLIADIENGKAKLFTKN